jgi:predicted secreted protein
MKRFSYVLLLCLAIIGCDNRAEQNSSLQPSVVVTDADDKKEVSLKRGQAIQIKLNGTGEADCFWGCKKAPSTVEFLTEGKEGNVFEFNFKVLEAGPITLEYVKFTENGVEKKKDYTINVKIAD